MRSGDLVRNSNRLRDSVVIERQVLGDALVSFLGLVRHVDEGIRCVGGQRRSGMEMEEEESGKDRQGQAQKGLRKNATFSSVNLCEKQELVGVRHCHQASAEQNEARQLA